MAVELTFGYGLDEPESLELATNTGWQDVCRFVGSLREGTAPGLAHLCAFGWATGSDTVQAEILTVAIGDPTPPDDVIDTLSRLSALLDGVDPETTITVDQ